MKCEYGCGNEGLYLGDTLSAQIERSDVELLKFGETLTGNADGNPEPSSCKNEKV